MSPNQDGYIQKFFHHQLPYSPYYRNLFAKHNLKFTDINTYDDLTKIPFSSKADLLPSPEHPASARNFILQPDEKLIKQYAPKGKLISILLKKLTGQNYKRDLELEYKPAHIHFTTGRSTAPIPYFYSQYDLDQLQSSAKELFDILGASRDDVAISAFPFAPHLAFWLGFYGTRVNNLFTLYTGGGKILGTQKIIDAIQTMKCSLLMVIPGYGYHLLKEAAKQGKDFSNLKLIVYGGEAATEGFRAKVAEILKEVGAKDVKQVSTYAMTEGKTAWGQCHEDSDYHLYPDREAFELVDKDGKRVKKGERGEIVYTALDWRGSVVVRYRTGDTSDKLEFAKCPYCGRECYLLGKDIERAVGQVEVQLTKVKGELINPASISREINAIPEIDEWQIEIKKHNDDQFDLDEMILHLSIKGGKSTTKQLDAIKRKIRDTAFISPTVVAHTHEEMVEMVGLETELKDKRFVDKRKK